MRRKTIRERLALLLEDAFLREPCVTGIRVDPDWLHAAQGSYRTGGGDFYRWQGQVERTTAEGGCVRISVDSYTTMTQIVRSGGAMLVRDSRSPWVYDVYDRTGN